MEKVEPVSIKAGISNSCMVTGIVQFNMELIFGANLLLVVENGFCISVGVGGGGATRCAGSRASLIVCPRFSFPYHNKWAGDNLAYKDPDVLVVVVPDPLG